MKTLFLFAFANANNFVNTTASEGQDNGFLMFNNATDAVNVTSVLSETNGTVATIKLKDALLQEITYNSNTCAYQVDDKLFRISASNQDFQVLLGPEDTLNFNLCEPLKGTYSTVSKEAYAIRMAKGKCYAFTEGEEYARLNAQNNLEITRQSEHLCDIGLNKYTNLTIEMHCAPYSNPTYNDTDPCDYHIDMHSLQACPVATFQQVNNLIGVFFLISGLLITICGKKVDTFITEFLMMILVFCLIVSSYREFTETKNFWRPTTEAQWLRLMVVGSIAAVLSLIIVRFFGMIVKRTKKVGPMIIGTIMGFLTTFLILSSVDAILNVLGDYEMGPIETSILAAVGCLLGMFAGYKLSHLMAIVAKAIVSGYTMTRGLSMFIGHYPSEAHLLQDLLSDQSLYELDCYFLSYMFLVLVLTLLSLQYQLSQAIKHSHHVPQIDE